MWGVRACRVCLASGVRLHGVDPQARPPSLYHCLRDISGIAWSYGVRFVCYECAWQLRKAHGLRERSIRAHLLLEGLLDGSKEVTEADLCSIDRVAENFQSPLNTCKLESINIIEEKNTECSINNHLKIELEGAIVEGEGKIWLQDIDNVKQEMDDEWGVEISPDVVNDVEVSEWKEKKKHRKSKKAKVKKKAVTQAKINEKPHKVSRPQHPPARRKTKKELAAFYSRFVSVAPMTQQEAYEEMRKRLDAADRRPPAQKCELCHKGFLRAATYEKHMTKHDPKNGNFECDYCHFRFGNRHSLLDHFRHFHNMRFSCKRCAYTCTNRNLARQHEAWHNGTLYSCKHCSTNFSHYSAMQNHVRLRHALELPCRLCGRCFVGRRGVRAHQLRAHASAAAAPADGAGPAVGCEPCGVQFASADAHRRHLLLSARHGLAESTVVCAACGEPFASRADLRRHRRAQHAHQVDVGTTEAATRRAPPAGSERGARRPRARKPRPDMMCETCGKVFHTNWDFDTHRRKHTGEKPFKCKFCSKAFALKGILKVHLRSHTQEKPHSCGICHKAFAERSNMLRHMQVHSDSKPVSCEVCEKEFKNTSSLKVHVKYVHLKRPYPQRRRRAPPAAAAEWK